MSSVASMVLLLAASAVGMTPDAVVMLQESTTAHAQQMALEGAGMHELEQNVDKDLWLARQAQESADAEDEEIARLLAQLEGLDAEKDAAVKEAKQREIEAKEATAAKLKETAKQKFEVVHHAIEYKSKVLEEGALQAQQEAASAVDSTKKLQEESSALMVKAKTASEEYQNALTAGMTDKLQELQLAAKKAMEEAKETAKAAGSSSQAAKMALKHAAEVKERADKAMAMEKEKRGDLVESGLRWVSGPIFDRMKSLCEQDYPTFKQEYRKIRQSPTYAMFRWDIKQACHKARDDDLENEQNPTPPPTGDPHNPPLAPLPYPRSHTHFAVPKGGKVPKWCTTQYGAVPCTVLKKAKEAGLLGDIGIDKEALMLIETEEESPPSSAQTSFESSPDASPTSEFPGPRHGLPGYKESHNWESDVDVFSPVVFDPKYFGTMYGDGGSEAAARKDWKSFIESDAKVPDCKQASSSFSLNTYYRANEADLKEQTDRGKCGQVLKQYLSSGIYNGASTYSATAEARFKAGKSAEELDRLQGNAHAQKIKLESESLAAHPNCDEGHVADSTEKYAWSFWYRPETAGTMKRNIMTYGAPRHGSASSSKHPFGSVENGPAIFETASASGNKLSFKVSQTNDDSWGCTPADTLSKDSAENKWNYVAVNVNTEGVQVYYNGKQVADCKNSNGKPKVFPDRRLYMATSASGQWEASRSHVKGLTFYPGSTLSSDIIAAEMQHSEEVAEMTQLELEAAMLKSKYDKTELGEANEQHGVVELADSIDAKLGVQLPEDQGNKHLVSEIDKDLGVQSTKKDHKARSTSASELASSIDSILWSQHTGRQNRAKTGDKLDELSRQSDQMDQLVDQSKSLKQEMFALRKKVEHAQKVVASHKANKSSSKVQHKLELLQLGENGPHDEEVDRQDEWEQKEASMRAEIESLRNQLEDANIAAKEHKLAAIKEVEATKARAAAESIEHQKQAQQIVDEAEAAKADAHLAKKTAEEATKATENESAQKLAQAESKAEEARAEQEKESAKVAKAAEGENQVFQELKQRAAQEIADAKRAAEEATGAQKLAAEEAVKAKEMALNEVTRAKEEAGDKLIAEKTREAMLEEKEKVAEQRAIKAEEDALATQQKAEQDAALKIAQIQHDADMKQQEVAVQVSQAKSDAAQAKAAQVAAEDRAQTVSQEANTAVESQQQAVKQAEEEALKAKQEAAEEVDKAHEDAKEQMLATTEAAEKAEARTKEAAQQTLVKQKAEIEKKVDGAMKGANKVFEAEERKAGKALAEAQTREKKAELGAKHATEAAANADASADQLDSRVDALKTDLQVAKNDVKVTQQEVVALQAKLAAAKDTASSLSAELIKAEEESDDARGKADEEDKLMKDAKSAFEAASSTVTDAFGAQEKVELEATKAGTEAKEKALKEGLKNVESSMEKELEAETSAAKAKLMKEQGAEQKQIDTKLSSAKAHLNAKLENAEKAMQLASDEKHKAEVDVTKAQRDAAEQIANIQHEVRSEEARAEAKKAEAKRVIDQANSDMDKALEHTKQTVANAKQAASLQIDDIKKQAAETLKAAKHATDDAKASQAEAHRQSEAAKEEAWKNEVNSMKQEAKQELDAAKAARQEAEDMREKVRAQLEQDKKDANAEVTAKHERAAEAVAAADEKSRLVDEKKKQTEEELDSMKDRAAQEAQAMKTGHAQASSDQFYSTTNRAAPKDEASVSESNPSGFKVVY